MKLSFIVFLLLLQFSFPWNEALEYSATAPIADSNTVVANIVFKSSDGGETWQDISEGLPENLQADAIQRDGFFADESGLFISTGNGIYHSKTNSTAPFWTAETFPDKQGSKTGGRVRKVVESDGVLLATSQRGIRRSTDGGETWDLVISEGGVGIAVERINGGFAAITFNTKSWTRRVRTSYDGGKTWQAIDAGLPASLNIASIIEVGGNFFCGHPTGVFRSSDKGKTWELLLPSIGDKVFNLTVSGNVIYAVPMAGGC